MRCTRRHPITKIMAHVAILFLAMVTVGVKPAVADDAQDARDLVAKARMTFESFVADPTMGAPLRNLVKKARGVLVYPQVLRGRLHRRCGRRKRRLPGTGPEDRRVERACLLYHGTSQLGFPGRR